MRSTGTSVGNKGDEPAQARPHATSEADTVGMPAPRVPTLILLLPDGTYRGVPTRLAARVLEAMLE